MTWYEKALLGLAVLVFAVAVLALVGVFESDFPYGLVSAVVALVTVVLILSRRGRSRSGAE